MEDAGEAGEPVGRNLAGLTRGLTRTLAGWWWRPPPEEEGRCRGLLPLSKLTSLELK